MTGAECDRGLALANAATALIGSPFRLHGRDSSTGLDCVGVVAAAMRAIGAEPVMPSGYALRNLTVSHWLDHAARSGLTAAVGAIAPGDVLLIALSHCQHHLAIAATEAMVVHAHAGLRQVVMQPILPSWQLSARWRISPAMKV